MIHKKIKIEYIYKWEVTYSTSLNSEMAIIGGTSGFWACKGLTNPGLCIHTGKQGPP